MDGLIYRLLLLDLLPDRSLVTANRSYVVTARQKGCPVKFYRFPRKLRAMWIALFPFKNPITWATAYLGGTKGNMWTFSIWRCASFTALSRCRARSRNTGSRRFRTSPSRSLRRPSGIRTPETLYSHLVWATLSLSSMERLLGFREL